MFQVKEWILDWLESNAYKSKQELIENSHKNYFDAGFLDSFGFISFVSAIEDYFDITFDDAQFQEPQFLNIDGLSEIISKLLGDRRSIQ